FVPLLIFARKFFRRHVVAVVSEMASAIAETVSPDGVRPPSAQHLADRLWGEALDECAAYGSVHASGFE
ncbi:MAG: hypothetical protein FWE61_11255, partial [Micrococcales bacterium]|nr:hypothetical protein [Micrococcales bacterium]